MKSLYRRVFCEAPIHKGLCKGPRDFMNPPHKGTLQSLYTEDTSESPYGALYTHKYTHLHSLVLFLTDRGILNKANTHSGLHKAPGGFV